MGAIKTMKEVEGALPKKKDARYIRVLDSEGNPSLISKADLAQVLGVGDSVPLTFETEMDFTLPSPEVKRTGGPDFPNWLENSVRNMMVRDGEINYWLDRGNSLRKKEGGASVTDGTDGDILNELPAFWYKPTLTEKGLRFAFSNVPRQGDGWIESPRIWAGATEMVIRTHEGRQTAHSCFNTGAEYRGGNGSNWDSLPKSLLGKPRTLMSHDAMRKACASKGTFAAGTYHNSDYRLFVKMNLMFMCIFGTRNWQAEFAGIDPLTGQPRRNEEGYRYGGLGKGVTDCSGWWNDFNGQNPFIPTSVGLELGCGSGVVEYELNTGSETKRLQVPVFCGIVNPFGHIWKAIDGLTKTIDEGRREVWGIFTDPAKYASSGIENAATVVRKDAVQSQGYLSKVDASLLPTEAKGSDSTHFCDMYHINANPGNYSLWVGGSAWDGGLAGGWSVISYFGVGTAVPDCGGRLCFSPS